MFTCFRVLALKAEVSINAFERLYMSLPYHSPGPSSLIPPHHHALRYVTVVAPVSAYIEAMTK